MNNDLIISNISLVADDYNLLIDNISTLWVNAKEKAVLAVNTELLEANWQTGKYIVEFEQKGKNRAEYGKQLLAFKALVIKMHCWALTALKSAALVAKRSSKLGV